MNAILPESKDLTLLKRLTEAARDLIADCQDTEMDFDGEEGEEYATHQYLRETVEEVEAHLKAAHKIELRLHPNNSGHYWASTVCGKCGDTGWRPSIEGRDGSYATSRPCSCEKGESVSRLKP